jgi:hypothetical protein
MIKKYHRMLKSIKNIIQLRIQKRQHEKDIIQLKIQKNNLEVKNSFQYKQRYNILFFNEITLKSIQNKKAWFITFNVVRSNYSIMPNISGIVTIHPYRYIEKLEMEKDTINVSLIFFREVTTKDRLELTHSYIEENE